MMKFLKFFNSFKWPVLGLVLTTVLFAACNKDDDNIVQAPAAGLMAFNLAVDKPVIGFELDGNRLGNAGINYTGFTGTYLPVFTGDRQVRSFDYNDGSTLAVSNQVFQDSMYYSAFLIGNNGKYSNLIVQDNYQPVVPTSGKAWVRYVNAIPDSMIVTNVSIGEINETANYGKVSDFQKVDMGSLDISVSNGGDVNQSRTINVEENKIYTVLFVGLPNQTDTSRNVMIRYIENGTATQ